MSKPKSSRRPARPAPARPSSSRPAGTSRSSRSSRLPVAVVAGVVAVVLLALVVAVVAGGGDGDDTATDAPAGGDTAGEAGGEVGRFAAAAVPDDTPATVTGTFLPPLTDADDPAVGAPMPTLSGTGLDGEPLTIPTTGRPTMIVFLAHWCPHCQAEVPVIQQWVDDGGLPDGVDLVAVSTAVDDRRPNHPPAAWLDREGWTSPVLSDGDDSAATAAGVSAFPFFVGVDAGGDVVGRASGELTTDQLSAIAAELAGGAS